MTSTNLKRDLPETQMSLQQVSKTLKALKPIGPKITQIINFIP